MWNCQRSVRKRAPQLLPLEGPRCRKLDLDLTLPQGVGMENYVAGIERALLQSSLNQSGGVQTKAADLLGISYRSFRHLMKKYAL